MRLSNPSRNAQGGDVEGDETTIVNSGLEISPLSVARASYVAGYKPGVETTYGFSMAQLKTGYASYGKDKTGSSED